MQQIILAILLAVSVCGCTTIKETYEATNVLKQTTWKEVWTIKNGRLYISHENGTLLSEATWEGHNVTSYSADGKYTSRQNTVVPLEWLEDNEKTFGHFILTRETDATSLVGVVSAKAKQVGDAIALLVSKLVPIHQNLLQTEVLTHHTNGSYLLPDRKEEKHYLNGELTQYFVYIKKK